MEEREPQALQFAEILALVDHVQAHYTAFVQAQAMLEHTWRTVADEIIDAFEAHTPGSAGEATGQDIQRMLHTLGPLTFNRVLPTNSFAGRWHQNLWLPEETATFTQQWVPFLRVFQQRRLERLPDRNQPVPFEEEQRSDERRSPEREALG